MEDMKVMNLVPTLNKRGNVEMSCNKVHI